jgi:chromosome segregation ATPase
MSVEIHDSLIALLAEVAALKEKEGTLKADKQRHLEAIATAEAEVTRIAGELDEVREGQLKAKRSMDDLRDELFKREDEEVILIDEAHDPAADAPSPETERHRSWKDRQKQLRTV